MHQEPLNPPPRPQLFFFLQLSRVQPAQRPLVPHVASMPEPGRVFPGGAVAHRDAGGCGRLWRWVLHPARTRGGRNPADHQSFTGTARGCRQLRDQQDGPGGVGRGRVSSPALYRGLEKLTGVPQSIFCLLGSLGSARGSPWGLGVFWSQGDKGQRPSELGGCGMLSFGDRGWFVTGMEPQPGTRGHVTVERRGPWGPYCQGRPTSGVPGRGVARAGAEERLLLTDIKWWT